MSLRERVLAWFLPEHESPGRLLSSVKATAAVAPPLDPAVAFLIHARIFEICASQRMLSDSEALHVASLLARALPAFWLLAQHSASTERTSRKELAAVLRAALGQPLALALESAPVFLDRHDA
jgi:hypothetical protein